MTDDIKPVAWAIFRDGALDWEHDQPFSDEPQSMMDDEESRPLYGGEVIAEIERLRAEMSLLTDANIRFGKRQDWWNDRMFELEQKNERLRADAGRYQWIRDRDVIDWDSLVYCCLPTGYEHPDNAINSSAMLLDAAIDAAMKEAK